MAYAARTGLELGADIVKINYNGNAEDFIVDNPNAKIIFKKNPPAKPAISTKLANFPALDVKNITDPKIIAKAVNNSPQSTKEPKIWELGMATVFKNCFMLFR